MMIAEPRVPPHSLEAEQSVLGALFIDPQAVVCASELLRADDFYREVHRQVFEAALAVFERREPIDLITMTEELRRRSWLEAVGGITYLGSLATFVPTAAHTKHYARIVQQKALLRALIASAAGVQEMAYSGAEELPALLDRAEQSVFAVTQRGVRREHHVVKDVLDRSLNHIEDLYRRKAAVTGVDTGFSDLNRLTSGLQPSDFIVIAGRPGHGKTTLALCLARHAALESDLPTLVFSLEMSAEQLCLRLLAAEAQVDGTRLRTGRLSQDDWNRLSEAAGRLGSAPLLLDDTPALTLMELRGRARRLRAEQRVGLIVVDYLQLISVPGRHENRQQEISEISRSLKALARELEVPIVTCSQLSRAVERRGEGSRPQLSDLRECLTGDTAVALASGEVPPIAELVGHDPEVVTMDGFQMTTAQSTRVWKVGKRPVYRLSTRTGRVVRATANHLFRQIDGWTALTHLKAGDRIAIPRACPSSSGIGWEPEPLLLSADLIGDGSSQLLDDVSLQGPAFGDVFWDEVKGIEPDGTAEVYDMEVTGTHNFVANGIIVHNSGAIEQDADLVAFIHFDPRKENRDVADFILAKQRNGPTDSFELYFRRDVSRFESIERRLPTA